MLNDFLLVIVSMIIGFGIGQHRGKNNTNKKIIKMLEDDQAAWLASRNSKLTVTVPVVESTTNLKFTQK